MFFNPTVALDIHYLYTGGSYDEVKVDKITFGGLDISANTGRFRIGVVWFVGKKRNADVTFQGRGGSARAQCRSPRPPCGCSQPTIALACLLASGQPSASSSRAAAT